jgi:hypothetical protein
MLQRQRLQVEGTRITSEQSRSHIFYLSDLDYTSLYMSNRTDSFFVFSPLLTLLLFLRMSFGPFITARDTSEGLAQFKAFIVGFNTFCYPFHVPRPGAARGA